MIGEFCDWLLETLLQCIPVGLLVMVVLVIAVIAAGLWRLLWWIL